MLLNITNQTILLNIMAFVEKSRKFIKTLESSRVKFIGHLLRHKIFLIYNNNFYPQINRDYLNFLLTESDSINQHISIFKLNFYTDYIIFKKDLNISEIMYNKFER